MYDQNLPIWIDETEAAGLIEYPPASFRKAVLRGSLKGVISHEKLNSKTYTYNKIELDNYIYETKDGNP